MKMIKNNEKTTIQKTDRKGYTIKYKMMRGYKIDSRKQNEKFDKDCLSETDMDEILAIC